MELSRGAAATRWRSPRGFPESQEPDALRPSLVAGKGQVRVLRFRRHAEELPVEFRRSLLRRDHDAHSGSGRLSTQTPLSSRRIRSTIGLLGRGLVRQDREEQFAYTPKVHVERAPGKGRRTLLTPTRGRIRATKGLLWGRNFSHAGGFSTQRWGASGHVQPSQAV